MNLRYLSPLVFTLGLSGCGVYTDIVEDVSKTDKVLIENGFVPDHLRSCGVSALKEVFNYFGGGLTNGLVSNEILNLSFFNNLSRGVMGVFDERANQITFPWEIVEVCKNRGYSVSEFNFSYRKDDRADIISKLERMMVEDSIGIVRLVSPEGFDQHWMAFFGHNYFSEEEMKKGIGKVINFYGEGTHIPQIYLIKRR